MSESRVCPIRVFDVRDEDFKTRVFPFHKFDKGKIRILLNGKQINYCFLFNLDTGECGYYPDRGEGFPKGPYVDQDNPGEAVRRFETGELEYYDGEGQRWI